MIGIVDVEVQAANPQMPLCPFVAFVGSPSSVRVRNVPGNIGSWNITKVYVSANYPDNSIQSRECTRVGEIYVGTLPACDTAGKGANGFAISADGVDESGNAVTGYVLGKGDLEILDADGAITPGVTTHYVHGLDEQPSDPHEYDIYKDGDTWKIYFNGAWGPLAPAPVTLDDAVTRTSANGVKSSGIWSAIWGALSALPAGFSSLYDWCVAQFTGKFAQYYPDGSVKSTTEFTQGIKYNAPDTVNRTITVRPFCNTVSSANNSGLIGRVVIPPFVDVGGYGYISDNGRRFKVVGVSGGISRVINTNLTAIVAPSTVTTIGNSAFSDSSALTSVAIPAATTIVDYAFNSCTALTSVSLPAAETIREGVFMGCTALTSVSLPAATSIGDSAFYGCDALTSVDFGDTPRPTTVPTLGNDAFYDVQTSCKIIVPYTQYDAWKAASGWSDLPQEFVRHAEKADKPATFTAGNLAKFDTNGNPVDSEKKPSDFQSALSAQQLANIAAVSDALAFNPAYLYAPDDPVVYNGTLYTFTAAHTGAWTGSDVSAVDIIARLADKLDKSGDTMTGSLHMGDNYLKWRNGNLIYWLSTNGLYIWTDGDDVTHSPNYIIEFPLASGTLALTAANPTAGNLAALDASGNPTDAGWTAGDLARYALTTKTISNGAVTLDGRAINAVAVSSSLASLTVNFPAATSGKVRDFALRLNIASGVTAPEIAWPQGVTLENDGGEVPEIADGGTGGSSTILYFSETENNETTAKFLVKGETLTAIAQA